jgi:integrase
MRVRQVQKKQVEDWIDLLIIQKPQNNDSDALNPHSIRNAFALLRLSFNIAIAEGMIVKNPCTGVELPRPEDEEIHPHTPEQVGMFFTLLDTHDKGKRHRNAALYHVAIRCGLRQAELLGLRWKDIDLERRVLHVAGQLKDKAHAARGKTPRARRTVPLSADTVDALRWHKQLAGKGSPA